MGTLKHTLDEECNHACAALDDTFVVSSSAPPTYGDRLGSALAGAGKSRAELAAHLGISVQAVGQIINGHSKAMSAENTARAAVFLGCSVYWLATGDQPPMSLREPGATYANRWPFPSLTPESLQRLPQAQRDIVEAVIARTLEQLRDKSGESDKL